MSDLVWASDLVKTGDEYLVLDMVAAAWMALEVLSGGEEAQEAFAEWVSTVCREHRVGYEVVDGELLPFSPDELMTEAVQPALRLLVDRRLGRAHGAYLEARP